MRAAILCLLLCLAACSDAHGMMRTDHDKALVEGWRTAVGETPTKAEFAAVYAACADRVKEDGHTMPFSGCLADLGLRPLQ